MLPPVNDNAPLHRPGPAALLLGLVLLPLTVTALAAAGLLWRLG